MPKLDTFCAAAILSQVSSSPTVYGVAHELGDAVVDDVDVRDDEVLVLPIDVP